MRFPVPRYLKVIPLFRKLANPSKSKRGSKALAKVIYRTQKQLLLIRAHGDSCDVQLQAVY